MTTTMEEIITMLGAILVLNICVFLFLWAIKEFPATTLKREAIERNFAEYNSTNGVWQWKTNSAN